MILKELAKYFQSLKDEEIQKTSCTKLAATWIKNILKKEPQTNVEKIIHTEITLAENNIGDYFLVAKSSSGRVLTNAIYKFALSYEQQILARWIQDKKPKDFK